jgi:hypothetical protein
MTPKERELLTGMGNCYASCQASFEETVQMVGRARNLTSDQVKRILNDFREKYRADPDYQKLRNRLPEDFPF